MLEVGDVIIVPGLGLPTDQEALNQIQDLFPNHDVCQVNIFEIVKKVGRCHQLPVMDNKKIKTEIRLEGLLFPI